jgi:hypothetical protein
MSSWNGISSSSSSSGSATLATLFILLFGSEHFFLLFVGFSFSTFVLVLLFLKIFKLLKGIGHVFFHGS